MPISDGSDCVEMPPHAANIGWHCHHDKILSADTYKQAEFCSMCGPKYCPMQIKSTDGDSVMSGEGSECQGSC